MPLRFAMNSLTIEQQPGVRQKFTFVGWRDDGNSFYARDASGMAKYVELRAHYPHNLDTGYPFEFPKVEPVEIFPVLLVPPTCGFSKQDVSGFPRHLDPNLHFLYPQPEHEEALRRSLKEFQAKAAKECAAEIARLKKTPGFTAGNKAAQQRQIKKIEGNYDSGLTLTLDQLKSGETTAAQKLRDEVLVAAWASETGHDLKAMRQVAKVFESQWWTAAGKGRRMALEAMRDAQSAVRFGIRFAVGGTFYLSHVSIRDLTMPGDAEQFQKLVAMIQPETTGKAGWHTPDFRVVWRQGRGGRSEEHNLTNEFRAVCLLLEERPGKSAQYAELEAKIGIRTRQLDELDGHGSKSSPASPRRVRDLLKTQEGRRLLEWGILQIQAGVGREKFLKVCPPTPGA